MTKHAQKVKEVKIGDYITYRKEDKDTLCTGLVTALYMTAQGTSYLVEVQDYLETDRLTTREWVSDEQLSPPTPAPDYHG